MIQPSALRKNLSSIRNATLASYEARAGTELAQPLEAMESVLLWNVLYNPAGEVDTLV